MKQISSLIFCGAVVLLAGCGTTPLPSKTPAGQALQTAPPDQIKVVFERIPNESASADFAFKNIPKPAKNDGATAAQFTLVDGRRDSNGGSLNSLHDGKVPLEEDQPSENFFFRQGTDGGRIQADLGSDTTIKQIDSYSWHPGTRGPQVYILYASNGKGDAFNAQPKKGTDPEKCGWKLVAKVDTRPSTGEGGGQYGVSIFNSAGPLGKYRYLLFDIFRTEESDSFGNTFYGEIDVIDQNGPAVEFVEASAAQGLREIVEVENGKYIVTIDTTETPDLTDWAHKELAPVVQEWYPKLVQMLPSQGYEAPAKFTISFSKTMQGVAATSGTRIRCAAKWVRANLKGEAVGSILHEMVHVVQQYGRRSNPGATRVPGWLTEGLTDYIRWYKYEPQSHGAEITRRSLVRARYDGSYRVTANFLNWATEKYDQELLKKINAAIREGRYNEDFWKQLTGQTLPDLGDAWKKELEKNLGGVDKG